MEEKKVLKQQRIALKEKKKALEQRRRAAEEQRQEKKRQQKEIHRTRKQENSDFTWSTFWHPSKTVKLTTKKKTIADLA